jgi:small subunit ribosomal protein S7
LIVLAFAKTPTEAKGEKKCRRRSVSSRQIRRHHLQRRKPSPSASFTARLDFIEKKNRARPLEAFHMAIGNIKPMVEVPPVVRTTRCPLKCALFVTMALAMQRLKEAARSAVKSMILRLANANELMENEAAAARHEKSSSSLHGKQGPSATSVSKALSNPTNEAVPLKRPGFVGLRKPG